METMASFELGKIIIMKIGWSWVGQAQVGVKSPLDSISSGRELCHLLLTDRLIKTIYITLLGEQMGVCWVSGHTPCLQLPFTLSFSYEKRLKLNHQAPHWHE